MDIAEVQKSYLETLIRTEAQNLTKNEVYVMFLEARIASYTGTDDETKFKKDRDTADKNRTLDEIKNNKLYLEQLQGKYKQFKK